MPLDVDIDGRQEMGSMNTFTDREGKREILPNLVGKIKEPQKAK